MKYALLIEGAKAVLQYQNGDFTKALSGPTPELYHMHEIANANEWNYFDPITSFDISHIFYALTKFTPQQHERLVHVILDFFRPKTPSDIITLQLFILPAYNKFLESKGQTVLPVWLSRLSQSDNPAIAEQKQEMIKTVYHKYDVPALKFEEESRVILKWMMNTSNKLSALELNRYLKAHPDITHVVGLVGLQHLDMLDSFTVKMKTPFNCLADCKIDGRIVNIVLFGSVHGEGTGFKMLCNYLKSSGFKLQHEPAASLVTQDTVKFLDLAGVRAITTQFDTHCSISEASQSSSSVSKDLDTEEKKNLQRNNYSYS